MFLIFNQGQKGLNNLITQNQVVESFKFHFVMQQKTFVFHFKCDMFFPIHISPKYQKEIGHVKITYILKAHETFQI